MARVGGVRARKVWDGLDGLRGLMGGFRIQGLF